MNKQYDKLFSIMLIGNSFNGRSSLIWRFVENEFLDNDPTKMINEFMTA